MGLTSQSIVRRSASVSVRALHLTMIQSAFSSHSSTHQPADAVDNQVNLTVTSSDDSSHDSQ